LGKKGFGIDEKIGVGIVNAARGAYPG